MCELAAVAVYQFCGGEVQLNARVGCQFVHEPKQWLAEHGHRVIGKADGEYAIADRRLARLPREKRLPDEPCRVLGQWKQ